MRKIYFLLAALFMLVPFNLLSQDGNPDTSFGGNGTVQTDLSNGASDLAFSIAQAPDGKLLVAGGIDIGDFIFHPAIVQYNSNGELTQSFGNDGILSRDYGSGFDFYTHVGAQTDGKVIAGGSIGQFGNKDVICKRGTDIPLSIGNDLKSAATDALKKCASELGLASDIYGKLEFKEIKVVDSNEDKLEVLKDLFVKYGHLAQPDGLSRVREIIGTKEEASYDKAIIELKKLI